MDRRFWLAVLAYVLPTFPLGYFWHLSEFAEQYGQLAMYREQVIIPMPFNNLVCASSTSRAGQ